MRAYSVDLRERIVEAVKRQGMSKTLSENRHIEEDVGASELHES